jgi:hypothetical protein
MGRLFREPAPVDFFEHVQDITGSIDVGGDDVLQLYTSKQALKRYQCLVFILATFYGVMTAFGLINGLLEVKLPEL